jgi:hypothetical protein
MGKNETPPLPAMAASVLPGVPLIITDSGNEYAQIVERLEREIRPTDIIEQTCVEDFAHLAWDVRRLRRCKAAMINSAFPEALGRLLRETRRCGFAASESASEESAQANMESERSGEDLEALIATWFTDEATKRKVAEVLALRGLDERAIEAEAVRIRAKPLELIEKLLASAEARRNKSLRLLAEYRSGLAKQLRASSNQIIDAEVASDGSSEKHSPA